MIALILAGLILNSAPVDSLKQDTANINIRIDSIQASPSGLLVHVDSSTLKSVVITDSNTIDLGFSPEAPKTIEMHDRIGDYVLYWKTLYTAYIANDEASVIELPNGFTIEQASLGNKKLFSLEQGLNRVVLKKLAFDDVATTLVIQVSTPYGTTQSFAVVLKAIKEQSKTTSIARFVVPMNRETNKTIENIKTRYIQQMNNKLKAQEDALNESVWRSVINQMDVFRIPEHLSSTEDDYKGAKFRIDAVVNSRDEAFIYTSTTAIDADQRECRITELKEVVSKDEIIHKRVQLFSTKEVGKRIYQIYRTSRMTAGKWVFHAEIWSKPVTITTKLELGEE